MKIYDRLVEDQDFYVRVQKTKLKLVVVLLVVIAVFRLW